MMGLFNRQRRVGMAMLVLGVLSYVAAPRAMASPYTWATDGGDWSDNANWNPGSIPGTGDTATVGDGLTAITMKADGSEPTPDSVTVNSLATVQVIDDIGTNATQNFIIKSGGTLDSRDYNNKGWNATLEDGSIWLFGQLQGAQSGNTIAISGNVAMTSTVNTNQTVYHPILGTGTITLSATAGTATGFGGGIGFAGELHVTQGGVSFANGDPVGNGIDALILRLDAGTVNVLGSRYQSTESLNGTQTLILGGTGGNAATFTFNDLKETTHTYTVYGAIFGDTVVPAGTYTIGSDYTDYLIDGSGDGHTLTFEVLNTLTVPEPASVALLALGAGALLPRRRAVRGRQG